MHPFYKFLHILFVPSLFTSSPDVYRKNMERENKCVRYSLLPISFLTILLVVVYYFIEASLVKGYPFEVFFLNLSLGVLSALCGLTMLFFQKKKYGSLLCKFTYLLCLVIFISVIFIKQSIYLNVRFWPVVIFFLGTLSLENKTIKAHFFLFGCVALSHFTINFGSPVEQYLKDVYYFLALLVFLFIYVFKIPKDNLLFLDQYFLKKVTLEKEQYRKIGKLAVNLTDKINSPLNVILLEIEELEDCPLSEEEKAAVAKSIKKQIYKIKGELGQLKHYKQYTTGIIIEPPQQEPTAEAKNTDTCLSNLREKN